MSRTMVYVAPFLFTMLFGVFDAAQTARKDYPEDSVFWAHSHEDWAELVMKRTKAGFRDSVENGLTKFTTFDLWYIGGNDYYFPPKYFWTSDFWHAMKNLWVLCISGISISCIMVGYLFNERIRWLRSVWTLRSDRWRIFVRLTPFVLYVFLYWLEGATFSFFYHYVFQ